MNSAADLLSCFSDLDDPRVDRTKRYPLLEIVFLCICATISGCEGWKSIRDFGVLKIEWLRKFLPYTEGVPVDDTIARVLRKLNTKQFRDCFILWMKGVSAATAGDVVAIDGKTLTGSYDKSSGKDAIHMVSAWSTSNSLVLGQEKTKEKSNEITAIPELLDVLELKGCIVSIDAMGCQEQIAKKIIDRKADYVLALKGNQGLLHRDVKSFFEAAEATDFQQVAHDFFEDVDSGHGRVESRRCWTIDVVQYKNCFDKINKWKNLKKMVMVKTKRELTDKTTEDTRFYISSCDRDAGFFLETIRKHWQIENCLHWTLDVTFKEDESRIRMENSPENYAMIRHIALNIVRNFKEEKASVKRKLHMAALDDNFRYSLIKQVI